MRRAATGTPPSEPAPSQPEHQHGVPRGRQPGLHSGTWSQETRTRLSHYKLHPPTATNNQQNSPERQNQDTLDSRSPQHSRKQQSRRRSQEGERRTPSQPK